MASSSMSPRRVSENHVGDSTRRGRDKHHVDVDPASPDQSVPFVLSITDLTYSVKVQNKNIQERKERRWVLERKLASSGVPKEEQINMIKDLERKEIEFMRLKRNKISVDDFELLTIIGRGAFGEVRLCREKKSENIYAMKNLKKSEMVMRGQAEHVRAERNLLAEVASHYIVKLYYSFQVLFIHIRMMVISQD